MMLYIAINITAMLITKLKNKGKIFMVKNKIVVLLGKSASGKTTILNKLVDETNLGLNRWVSYTTRPRRQNEVNGYDYHFIPLETFKTLSLVDERVYHTNVNGHSETWYYGHTDEPNTIDKDFIVIADPDGFRQLIKRYGRNRIFAVYIDCDEGVRKVRCKQRKDFDESEWERRAKDDEKVFEDIYKEVDLTIGNAYLETSIKQIEYSYLKWLTIRTQEDIEHLVEQYQLVIRNILETTNITEEQAKTLTHLFKDAIELTQRRFNENLS
jgi:guanylate kinase